MRAQLRRKRRNDCASSFAVALLSVLLHQPRIARQQQCGGSAELWRVVCPTPHWPPLLVDLRFVHRRAGEVAEHFGGALRRSSGQAVEDARGGQQLGVRAAAVGDLQRSWRWSATPVRWRDGVPAYMISS